MTGSEAFRRRDAARKSVRRARAALESIDELLEPSRRSDPLALEAAVHELLRAGIELQSFSKSVGESAKPQASDAGHSL